MADTSAATPGEKTDAPSTSLSGPKLHEKVIVHPIVLLSVVDHYNRLAKDTKKRVVGMLLGSVSKGVVDVTNCYAVPFEEDERDLKIWYLDHSYHEQMYGDVQKGERVGEAGRLVHGAEDPPRRPADRRARPPLHAQPGDGHHRRQAKDLGIPTEAYHAVEEIREGSSSRGRLSTCRRVGRWSRRRSGVSTSCATSRTRRSTLANRVTQKLGALKGLAARAVRGGGQYLFVMNVLSGRLPVNHRIVYELQDIFNLLPNLDVDELVKAFAVKTNDMMLAIYLSSIIRAVVALHNLVDNRLVNKDKERASDEAAAKKEKGEKEGDKDKDKDGKDGKGKDGKEAKDEKKK